MKRFWIVRNYTARLSILAIFVVFSFSSGLAHAQSGEDYYSQRLKILETCKGDEDCLRRSEKQTRKKAQSGAKTQKSPSEKTSEENSSSEESDELDFSDLSDGYYDEMSDDELIKEIEEAKLFRDLNRSKISLESSSKCGAHREKATETRDALDELNSRVQNKTSDNYGRQALEFKNDNTRAVDDYERCYATHLPRYEMLKLENILTHAAHTAKYNEMVNFYSETSDLSAHIAMLERELRFRANRASGSAGDVIAKLAKTHRTVEILPAGRGNRWKRAIKGQTLRLKDHLRTGPKGRARIVFADRYEQGTSGPTVVNMGSRSHVRMESFAVELSKKRTTVIGLIRGSLRAFTNLFGGPGGAFTVRTGTSLCGIRGTEVAISYNPDANTADYHLDHGDAYVETGGKQTTLTPKTSRTISNGILSAERPLTKSDWSQILTSTGNGMAETMTTANQSYSELLMGENSSNASSLTGGNTSHNDAGSTAGIKSAEDLVEQFYHALKYNDEALLGQTIGGRQKDMMDKGRKNKSLKAWLDENKERPTRFDIKCTLCEEGLCQTVAYVESEANFPGAGKDILFEVTNTGYVPNPQRVTASYIEKEKIAAFRLKSPVCRQ